MGIPLNMDDKVRIRRTVTIEYEMDMSDYMDEEDITDETLKEEIPDYQGIDGVIRKANYTVISDVVDKITIK